MLEIRKDKPNKWLYSNYFRSYNTVYKVVAIKSVRNNIVTFSCNAIHSFNAAIEFRKNIEVQFEIKSTSTKVILENAHYDYWYAKRGDYVASLIRRKLYLSNNQGYCNVIR